MRLLVHGHRGAVDALAAGGARVADVPEHLRAGAVEVDDLRGARQVEVAREGERDGGVAHDDGRSRDGRRGGAEREEGGEARH